MDKEFLASFIFVLAALSSALTDQSICDGIACETGQTEGIEMLQKKNSMRINSGQPGKSFMYEWFHADCPGAGNIKQVNGDNPAAQSQCNARGGCVGWSVHNKTNVRRLRSTHCKPIATGKWIYFKKMGEYLTPTPAPPTVPPTVPPTAPPTVPPTVAPPATCKLNKYWTGELTKGGIAPSNIAKLCGNKEDKQWYYNGKGTKVGFGSSTDQCNPRTLRCRSRGRGSFLMGYSADQVKWVKAAIQNGGVFPLNEE